MSKSPWHSKSVVDMSVLKAIVTFDEDGIPWGVIDTASMFAEPNGIVGDLLALDDWKDISAVSVILSKLLPDSPDEASLDLAFVALQLFKIVSVLADAVDPETGNLVPDPVLRDGLRDIWPKREARS